MWSSARLRRDGVESRGSMMNEGQPVHRRESVDRQFVAWYVESWYDGHHYRFFSCSPWHLAGTGTRYGTEEEARAAVDWYMDVWVPRVVQEHGGEAVWRFLGLCS